MSGVSFGWTRWPSKRKRTELTVLPWRSQKAPMSFSSLVDFFILKKTSLLLSVTLMLRCSVCTGASGRSAAGEPFSCWSDDIAAVSAVAGVEDELVDEDRDERVGDEGAPGDEPSDEKVSVHRDDGSENVTHDGRFVTLLGTFWWLREVVLVMAMRDACAGILGSWTYRLVALCGSGLIHESPKLVSAGWGRAGWCAVRVTMLREWCR